MVVSGMGMAVGRRLMLTPPCILSVCLLSPLDVVKWVLHRIAMTAKFERSASPVGACNRSG